MFDSHSPFSSIMSAALGQPLVSKLVSGVKWSVIIMVCKEKVTTSLTICHHTVPIYSSFFFRPASYVFLVHLFDLEVESEEKSLARGITVQTSINIHSLDPWSNPDQDALPFRCCCHHNQFIVSTCWQSCAPLFLPLVQDQYCSC